MNTQKNHADLFKKVPILKFKMEALNVNCKPGTHLFLKSVIFLGVLKHSCQEYTQNLTFFNKPVD